MGFPGKIEYRGHCELKPGQTRPNGESVPDGAGMHPRNHGGDPDVTIVDGEYRMVFNHPVWDAERQRWPTSIFSSTSEDGLLWTVPKPVLLPIETGSWQPIQFETPSLRYLPAIKKWGLAVLEYQYRPGWNRVDTISFWLSSHWNEGYERVGTKLEPALKYEESYNPQAGGTYGGCQEPSLLNAGTQLWMPYGMVTYSNGLKPSVGLAVSLDGAQTWFRLSEPLVEAPPEAWGGAGQPNAVLDPEGGIHIFWQQRMPGNKYEFHHGFMPAGSVRVHKNPNNPLYESDIRATAIGATWHEGAFHCWWFGSRADRPLKEKWIHHGITA